LSYGRAGDIVAGQCGEGDWLVSRGGKAFAARNLGRGVFFPWFGEVR